MKNITIDSEKDLKKFLELVSQESVKKSLREVDSRVSVYNDQKKRRY